MKESERLDFLRRCLGASRYIDNRCGIPYLAIMAQAVLESGWGKDAIGFNVFGIKAVEGQPSITVTTQEHHKQADKYKGHKGFIRQEKRDGFFVSYLKDEFAKYESMNEAFEEHAKLLLSERYIPALGIRDPKEYLSAIARLGYATNIGYAAIASNVVDSIKRRIKDI